MRLDLLQQLSAPRISLTHADICRELRKMFSREPERAEVAIGLMYGHAFKKAEEAYAARGSRGRQRWTTYWAT